MARGDKLIQIKDSKLYDRIEQRAEESGAGSMAEVIRRVMEVALLIDEVNYPADHETLEHQIQRAKRLRRLLAPAIEELSSMGQLPMGILAVAGTVVPNTNANTSRNSPAELEEAHDDDDGLSGSI